MITGSTPTVIWSTIRARGFRPSSSAFSRAISSTAAAPSEICDELPAVILPSSLKAGFSAASVSSVGAGTDALVGDVGVAVDRERDDLALEAALLGRLVRELRASARASSSSSERGISHWSAIISAEMPCGIRLYFSISSVGEAGAVVAPSP